MLAYFGQRAYLCLYYFIYTYNIKTYSKPIRSHKSSRTPHRISHDIVTIYTYNIVHYYYIIRSARTVFTTCVVAVYGCNLSAVQNYARVPCVANAYIILTGADNNIITNDSNIVRRIRRQ